MEAAADMPSSGGGVGAGWAPEGSEAAEWRRVYQDFVELKQQCGESTDGFTYDKFEATLKKNRDTLMSRHGAQRVKFSVYVKEAKAALKASPINECVLRKDRDRRRAKRLSRAASGRPAG
jgi:hypothetical protein